MGVDGRIGERRGNIYIKKDMAHQLEQRLNTSTWVSYLRTSFRGLKQNEN